MFEPSEKPGPLSSYLQPRISATRLERNRAAVAQRLQRRHGLGWLWMTAPVGCAILAVWLVWGAEITGSVGQTSTVVQLWEPTPGAAIEAHAEALGVQLGDGTHLELQPRTALGALAAELGAVDLELRGGRASFDVAHDPGRKFRVHAGGVLVTVLGTRFSVARDHGEIAVTVERGKVAVAMGNEVIYLAPGQQWKGAEVSAVPGSAERGVSAVESGSGVVHPAPSGAPAGELPAPKAGDLGGASAAKTNGLGIAAETEHERASEPSQPESSQPESSQPEPSQPEPSQPEPNNPAKELFDASRDARRAGNSRRAAELLQQLVTQYPKDPRAGLAAFELGRIRADVLGDTGGAIQALEQALRLAPNGGFRQDALARLAQAYDLVGRPEACKAARQKYLAAYGQGVHAQRVLKLCP